MQAEAILQLTPQDRESVVRALAPYKLAPHVVEQSLSASLKTAPHAALIVIDETIETELDAMRLNKLRRSYKSRLRRTPVVVLVRSRDSASAWGLSGAVPLQRPASAAQWREAISTAMDPERPWVDSITYVGPCRRFKKQMFRLKKRRTADLAGGEINVHALAHELTDADSNESLSTLVRQLRVGLMSLSMDGPPGRSAYLTRIDSLTRAAMRRRDDSLVKLMGHVRAMVAEAGPHGPLDTDAVEAQLAAWIQAQPLAGSAM